MDKSLPQIPYQITEANAPQVRCIKETLSGQVLPPALSNDKELRLVTLDELCICPQGGVGCLGRCKTRVTERVMQRYRHYVRSLNRLQPKQGAPRVRDRTTLPKIHPADVYIIASHNIEGLRVRTKLHQGLAAARRAGAVVVAWQETYYPETATWNSEDFLIITSSTGIKEQGESKTGVAFAVHQSFTPYIYTFENISNR